MTTETLADEQEMVAALLEQYELVERQTDMLMLFANRCAASEAQCASLEAKVSQLEASLDSARGISDHQQEIIDGQQKLIDSLLATIRDWINLFKEELVEMCVAEAVGPETEKTVERHFYRSLDTYLPGASKVEVGFRGSVYPDGFVRMNGATCPVECKKGVFDKKARDQLLNYMKVYDMPQGIAVAPELHRYANLPSNITFVEVDKDLLHKFISDATNKSRKEFSDLVNSLYHD